MSTRICPKCRAVYPPRGRATCEKDGTRLVDAEDYARFKNDPLIGRTIGNRFKIVERIGTGGMGTVYRAEQAGLLRPVALKVLKRELVSDRDTVARFQREAKAMSMLMHPNTVRVFDFGEDEEGWLYLAMELLEGELLTAWMERDGAPPVDQAVLVVQELLRSLSEAHSKGIIHRDLKPDNIFLARIEGHARPAVKVLDFGIAKAFRDDIKIDTLETQAGTVFGTPRYMSPEQAQGKALDHRSDLYAVGVLLYHLLTGAAPFMDDDAVVVMAKHIRERPMPVREAAPDRRIPRSLERAVQHAMEKDPDKRVASAEELEHELGTCMPDVHREGGSARARSGLRVPIAIGASLILGAIAIAAVLVIASPPEDTASARDIVQLPGHGAPPPVATPPPPAPAPLPISIDSRPSGASVFVGGEQVGSTPMTLRVEPEQVLALTLRADGFEPSSLVVNAQTPREQVVTLEAVHAPPPHAIDPPAQPPHQEHEHHPQTPPTRDPYSRFD